MDQKIPFRQFNKDAVTNLTTKPYQGKTMSIEDIAEYMRDKPVYIQKLLDGESFLAIKKIKHLIYARPRTLKKMSKNYWIEEGELANVPEGGCSLHDYIFPPKEHISRPRKSTQLNLQLELATHEQIAASLKDNGLRIVVMTRWRGDLDDVLAVVLASALDCNTTMSAVSGIDGIAMKVIWEAEDIKKFAETHNFFYDELRAFAGFRFNI